MNGRTRGLVAAGAIALVAAGVACSQAGGSTISPKEVMDGNVLYAQNCSACHGSHGRGSIAPSLADPLYQQLVTDADLRRIIGEGRPAYQMPAFAVANAGSLSDAQITALIGAIRGFTAGRGTPGPDAPRLGDNLPAGDAGRGRQVFAQACARCHGADGEGGSAGAINSVPLLALSSDAALRRVIITGIAGRQPDYAHLGGAPLNDQQISDLVALLASWRAAATPASGQPANGGRRSGTPAAGSATPSR